MTVPSSLGAEDLKLGLRRNCKAEYDFLADLQSRRVLNTGDGEALGSHM